MSMEIDIFASSASRKYLATSLYPLSKNRERQRPSRASVTGTDLADGSRLFRRILCVPFELIKILSQPQYQNCAEQQSYPRSHHLNGASAPRFLSDIPEARGQDCCRRLDAPRHDGAK